MMNDRVSRINSYFDGEISRCQALEAELSADSRGDEAIFARVRKNVFDIFKTVFSVALDRCGEDREEPLRFFLARAEQIPESWRQSLQKAEKYGDTEKAHLEHIKLGAIDEITAAFSSLWEETA